MPCHATELYSCSAAWAGRPVIEMKSIFEPTHQERIHGFTDEMGIELFPEDLAVAATSQGVRSWQEKVGELVQQAGSEPQLARKLDALVDHYLADPPQQLDGTRYLPGLTVDDFLRQAPVSQLGQDPVARRRLEIVRRTLMNGAMGNFQLVTDGTLKNPDRQTKAIYKARANFLMATLLGRHLE